MLILSAMLSVFIDAASKFMSTSLASGTVEGFASSGIAIVLALGSPAGPPFVSPLPAFDNDNIYY